MTSNAAQSGLNYDPMPVAELFGFSAYYNVPKYQRGYSWGTEEVKELLTDLSEAQREFPLERYLLGQIIVCPTNERITTLQDSIQQMDLIDGQQRCTTLYLFILVASGILNQAPIDSATSVQSRNLSLFEIMKTVPDTQDNNLLHPRIKVAANGDSFINRILSGQSLESPESPTQANIARACSEIEEHLQNLGSSEKVLELVDFVLNQAWIVRLHLANGEQALRVFQKVNNRGLELDSADLIKNYLFQQVSNSEFTDLSKKWNDATDTLLGSKLKRTRSMEFLMKLLIGIETGQSIPTGKLYKRWEEVLRFDESLEGDRPSRDKVKELAYKLPSSASHLVLISKGIIPTNNQQTDLTTGILMQGWIQPFEILLAGSHLREDSYQILLRMVEDRTMLSYWAKEQSQAFERIIHPWAAAVARLDSAASAEEIYEAGSIARLDFENLSEAAFLGISKLNYKVGTNRDRLRYILARVNQALQGKLNVSTYAIRDLMKTTIGENNGFDLDHIFPQSASQRINWVKDEAKDIELGPADRYETSIHSIGNLVLLHPGDNRSQSDALPNSQEKKQNLGGSELYANRLLTSQENWPDSASRIKEELKLIQEKYVPEIDNWTEASIDNRAKFYWDILLSEIRKNLSVTSA